MVELGISLALFTLQQRRFKVELVTASCDTKVHLEIDAQQTK